MEDYLFKSASYGISMLFTQVKYESPIEFIDPLCSIFKLCILHHKYHGTKISIKDNKITLQDPSVLQGLYRWNDKRDQLHHLKIPIFYFKGIVSGYIKIGHLNLDADILNYINDLAIKGLKKIKNVYDENKPGSLIKNCIDEYIKTLSTIYSYDEFILQMNELNKPTLFAIYAEYSKLWKMDDFTIIMDLFAKAEEKTDIHMLNTLANCIDNFIYFKDCEIDKIRP